MNKPKHITILGSTGSIGRQALEVIELYPERFIIEAITAQSNADLLIRQALKYKPREVVIVNQMHYHKVKEALKHTSIHVSCGVESQYHAVALPEVELVLTAVVGFAGLLPTLHAIKNGKNIALANKETMVVAGDIVTRLAGEKKVHIYPVDSEHSAIFQCLNGEEMNPPEKIFLTASGGPFRTKKLEDLYHVTKTEALRHPNWAMGSKITIDSATLMNKGLEVIEAKWLFDLQPEQIHVVVHPQSIIHSLVQFYDGSIKAQMGLPDMKLPILYAFSYPERLATKYPRFNFTDYPTLTFEPADTSRFPNLDLAYQALRLGGNSPCIVNAANEEVVNAFLTDKLSFMQIPKVIEWVMQKVSYIRNPLVEDYIETDKVAREYALEKINSL